MELVPLFLQEIQNEQTRRAYRTDLRRFFPGSNVDESAVTDVLPTDVQSFVRSLRDAGESVSTQRRRLSALRAFYDWLITEGTVAKNPARHPEVKPLRPESDSTKKSVLGAHEVERLVDTAEMSPRTGLRDRALILTIVYGALRRSEVAALEVDDVRPLGRYWILDLSEDAQGSDYVRIPEAVVEAIERMKDAYDITKGALWRSRSNQNRGAPMSPDAIYKVIRRVAGQAGLDSVSIDELRRTGLQLALEGGATLPQVRAHGRFNDSASVARLVEERSSELGASAVEHIELEIGDLTSQRGD